jgi:hypothetical protein
MVYHAKSNNVKKIDVQHDQEEWERQAVAEYERARAAHEKKVTLHHVAREFGVDKSTLSCHVKGKGKSMLDFNAKKQKLTPMEEHILVEFILESANHGFSMENPKIKMTANAVLLSRLGMDCEMVRKSWVFHFKNRHAKKLQTFWGSVLDSQHAASLNPIAIQSFQDICEEYTIKLSIHPG